jgi:hypothetical protein
MKSNKLFLAIVTGVLFASFGTSAFANDKTNGEGDANWLDHIVSSKTRAQVVAELKEGVHRANCSKTDPLNMHIRV